MKIDNIVCISSDFYRGWNESKFTCTIDGVSRELTYTQDRTDDGYGYTIRSDGDDIWYKLTYAESEELESRLLKIRETKWWLDDIENVSDLAELDEIETQFLYTEDSDLRTKDERKPIWDAINKRKSEIRIERSIDHE